ncbi:hemerythrin domain-containing protein [Sphingobium bisphenolivorans]|uniref:hemerythrin domain-containing protein n=1 Tax=Sphingobium bisphenolivorans TaxID=1335760 RepID=UPI0003A9A377|nr:hemerythrin domain-containing protein [Sphingobium bisphenolivorans]
MNLDELRQQHDTIEALARRFQQAVADEGSPQRLGTLRWQFARELMAHLAVEDRLFYPNIQRQSHEALRTMAARLQIEMAPLADRFSAYLAHWSDERIAENWPAFCRETRNMLSAILARVEKEERLLMPLLQEAGLNPLLKRAG